MESTVTAVAVLVALYVWHLHNRRHPGWRASSSGRLYVSLGYLLIMVAVYWLTLAPTPSAWEWALSNVWALGIVWALAATTSFVWGFEALNRVTADHAWRSQEMESIEPSGDSIRR